MKEPKEVTVTLPANTIKALYAAACIVGPSMIALSHKAPTPDAAAKAAQAAQDLGEACALLEIAAERAMKTATPEDFAVNVPRAIGFN